MKINKEDSLRIAMVIALALLCGTMLANSYVISQLNETLESMGSFNISAE